MVAKLGSWGWRSTLMGSLALLVVGCGDDGAGKRASGSGVPTEPTPLVEGDYTYSLSESTEALPLWTTPTARRVTVADRAPAGTKRSGLRLSAARNEFEPVQLLVGPAKGSLTASVESFSDLGSDQRVSLATSSYSNGWQDMLYPLMSVQRVSLDTDEATALWLTVYVPESAPAGEHETTLTLTPEGGAPVEIPVTLTVFDFSLPREIHFSSQLNLDISSLRGATVEEKKTLLFEHRLTPASVTWPSGLGWNITWDNVASPTRCSAFYDEADQGPDYSIASLAPRYLLGEGWNGVGFPDSEIFQFVDNSTPRPDTFCGIARGDALGTDEYNAAWSDWLTALDGYLVEHGLDARTYYYVQNEPQNAADYELAAALCRLTRAAAPHLRIAISEEPKPEIAENAQGDCGYDVWIAHVRAYQEDYAWQRQALGEQVWLYSLDQDPEPYFNPTLPDRSGLNARIIPWASWSHRARGWAYYDGARFFAGGEPTVTAELLREGFEDYEYLYLANGNAHPVAGESTSVDATVRSVAASMTSWTRDPDALMTLRHELGRYLEGSRDTLPVLQTTSSHPRAAYYLNFQNPAGAPDAEPLVVDGKTWLKIGWAAYDAELGYGWYGENIADPTITLYGYDDVEGYDELQKSYLYDDYGRDNLFEFSLEPGRYEVTVGVGRPAHGYPSDPNNVVLEGQRLIDDEATTDAEPVLERTVTVELVDGSLSLVVGGRSAQTGDYAYTFLAYLAIEPVD